MSSEFRCPECDTVLLPHDYTLSYLHKAINFLFPHLYNWWMDTYVTKHSKFTPDCELCNTIKFQIAKWPVKGFWKSLRFEAIHLPFMLFLLPFFLVWLSLYIVWIPFYIVSSLIMALMTALSKCFGHYLDRVHEMFQRFYGKRTDK